MTVSDDEIKAAAKHFADWDFGSVYDLRLSDPIFEKKDAAFQDYLDSLLAHAAKLGAATVLAEMKQEDGIVTSLVEEGRTTDEINIYIDSLSFHVSLKKLLKDELRCLSADEAKPVIGMLRQMIDEIETELTQAS